MTNETQSPAVWLAPAAWAVRRWWKVASPARAPVLDDELIEVSFALGVTEIQREQRLAKFERTRRRGVRWLVVAGMVLVALNLLLCVAYIIFSLAQQPSPL